MTRIKNELKLRVGTLILVATGLFAIGSCMQSNASEEHHDNEKALANQIAREKFQKDSLMIEDKLSSAYDSLVFQIDGYIKKISPKSKMSAKNIADLSIEHSYDIPLLLAQAHLESRFGTHTGGTNSVFGVIRRKFSHPDESVEDYIKLMKSRYLVTRTPEEALAKGMTLENGGGRYAEDPQYCYKIRKIRNAILRDWKIHELHKQYVKLLDERDSLIEERNAQLKES